MDEAATKEELRPVKKQLVRCPPPSFFPLLTTFFIYSFPETTQIVRRGHAEGRQGCDPEGLSRRDRPSDRAGAQSETRCWGGPRAVAAPFVDVSPFLGYLLTFLTEVKLGFFFLAGS